MKAQAKKITYPEDKRHLVEESLERYFPSKGVCPDIIYQAMRYSLFSGGKRFRPVLMLLCAEVFLSDLNEFQLKRVLPVACAIEYIHTYSLTHDDLPAIDNDSLRRGVPTCHIKFGEGIAILAGDALLTEAFYLIASENCLNSEEIVKVIRETSNAAGIRGMIGGQVTDILSTGKDIDISALEYIHEHKTGWLITASARVGAILGGASEDELESITDYAYHLGMVFQITDDILDVVGETKTLGKMVGSDAKLKKATFPSVLGIEESRRLAHEHVKKAIESLNKIKKNTSKLAELAYFVIERES